MLQFLIIFFVCSGFVSALFCDVLCYFNLIQYLGRGVCHDWSFLGIPILYGIYTERKKKRRVNYIPKFHSSLKKFVKYFTMITKRYMYGTKVPNFIGL